MKALLLLALVALAGCISTDRTHTMSNLESTKCLQQLISKDNFAAIPGTLYTGVRDPVFRTQLNDKFNTAVQLLIAATNRGAGESELLSIIDKQINSFDRVQLELDTEDAEQVASNFEHTLDCLHIKSSGGILNTWMYGFDPS